MPVAISVALTAAFGTNPPDGSVTVPLIVPRKVCALAATASENAMRTAITRRFIDSIPPFEIRRELTAPWRLRQKPKHVQYTNQSHSKATADGHMHSVIESRIRHLRTSPPDPLALSRFKDTGTLNRNVANGWSCNLPQSLLSRGMNSIHRNGKIDEGRRERRVASRRLRCSREKQISRLSSAFE